MVERTDDPSADDDAARREGDGEPTADRADGSVDPETEGIEILDDGADWLASQLAALPPDTTELPILPDPEPVAAEQAEPGRGEPDGARSKPGEPDASEPRESEPDESEPGEFEPGEFEPGDSEPGDSARAEEEPAGGSAVVPPTERMPIVPEAAPAQPATERVPAVAPESTPPLTRPRPADAEPAGAGAIRPAAVPVDAPDAAAVPAADSSGRRETTDGQGVADGNAAGFVARGEDDDAGEQAAPPPRAAHPQAIIIPGLPPRSAAAPAAPSAPEPEAPSAPQAPAAAASHGGATSGPRSDRAEAEPRVGEPAPGEPAADAPRVAAAPQSERGAAASPEGQREPAGEPAAETTEIPFGQFVWQLTPNDEPDPHLERITGAAAAPSSQRDEPVATAEHGPAAAPDAPTTAVPAALPAHDVDEARDADGSEPPADEETSQPKPTWSRPDLDGAFPATVAMDTLPADDDPDDPDDEIETRERLALGTSSMPVSAARAAAGNAEHVSASAGQPADPSAAPPVDPFPGSGGGDQRPPVLPPAAPGRRGTLGLVAAGLVVLVALAAFFYLGTRLPLILGGGSPAAQSATPTPTATQPPATDQPATGPVGPGTYAWDELRGGECLEPYSSPWAEEFTVVDCASPHTAQLVFAGPYTDDPATPFPGEEEIASRIGLLCSAPGVVDFGAAAPFTDLQVQGAYPVSAEQWAAGQRDYFCFASRSSGEPLTGSVAGTPAP